MLASLFDLTSPHLLGLGGRWLSPPCDPSKITPSTQARTRRNGSELHPNTYKNTELMVAPVDYALNNSYTFLGVWVVGYHPRRPSFWEKRPSRHVSALVRAVALTWRETTDCSRIV